MNFVARLTVTMTGSLFGGFLAGLFVSLYDKATSKGVPLIGAAFIGIIVGFAYVVLALIASVAGNLIWLALRPLASQYEPYALPLLIAFIDFMLLSEAVRSSDFFAAGGRYFPASVLLLALILSMILNSRNPVHG